MSIKTKTKKNRENYTVEITQNVNIFSVLMKAIEKYGARKIISQMAILCSLEYIHYTDSMAILFADKDKIENSEAGKILMYTIAHWDELAKTAGKWQYEKMQQYEIKNRSSS